MDSREAKWLKYKTDFLKANRCTVDEFERAYIAFQQRKPDEKAYRQFARKYHITIHPNPHIPKEIQAVLSVNIAAIKVMAESHYEAESAIAEILSGVEPKH